MAQFQDLEVEICCLALVEQESTEHWAKTAQSYFYIKGGMKCIRESEVDLELQLSTGSTTFLSNINYYCQKKKTGFHLDACTLVVL